MLALLTGRTRDKINANQKFGKNERLMASLDEVYRKFGEVCEAAQLLETELGSLLLTHKCIDGGLLEDPNALRATAIYDRINKQTLGALVRSLGSIGDSIDDLEELLSDAVASRNRLTHSFYLQHNFRRNSDNGRDVMLCDLEAIHEELLEAYKAVLLLSGVNLEKLLAEPGEIPLPTGHLLIRT